MKDNCQICEVGILVQSESEKFKEVTTPIPTPEDILIDESQTVFRSIFFDFEIKVKINCKNNRLIFCS